MLPITPERLSSVYEMLRAWPPFRSWRLPPADEVRFHVSRTRQWHAFWWLENGRHNIALSSKTHSHLVNVIPTMGHEMIHVKQRIWKTETRGAQHNAEFHRLSKRVCSIHGFDLGHFLG